MKKLAALILFFFMLPAFAGDIQFNQEVAQTRRVTHKWAFVFDGSASLWNTGNYQSCQLPEKSYFALNTVTQMPTDDMKFCMYLFGDKGRSQFREWAPASPDEFEKAKAWIANTSVGIFSWGIEAVQAALHQETKDLTVIIITDGGFTSACQDGNFDRIETAIATAQQWRVDNGYVEAVIATVGLENKHYHAGGKPSDETCQAFLRKLGRVYGGGYFYVSVPHAAPDNWKDSDGPW